MVTDSQTDDTTVFLRAARSGNLEKVIKYLDSNLDINIANSNGLNALHLASKDGHVEIVTELLKRGAKVDAATKKGNTALHIASLAGQVEVVNILIQYGAAVNTQSQNGFTPLYMAAQENHDHVVKLLLANGANQSLATEDGFTPLAVAMQQGHDKVVSVLLENDLKGKVRLPALHIAAKKDDCKAADLLLQNDHKPDVTSKSGFTPLHIAAHYGNEEIGRLLIKKGADVNYLAKHNISPLHVAAKWGKNNMVKLLLENSAIIDAKTRDGLTPLHCAARSGHEEVVSTLLEHSAPISARTKNGLAPLHMASQGDHVDAARVLLYHRAPVDEVTIDYLTSLHVAAHCGHVRVAKLLLDRKADPNARALNGFTPLHIACKKNRIKIVELLLKHGASIESTTESGLTPLHVSSFMGCMNIVIFLLQHEANPDVPTVRGETPLHLAARANQTDIIRILLRNGAKVDARAREDQTPLHIASRLGNVDIVMLLLQHGAAVDITTKDMYTALHIAAKEGQEEVAAILVENHANVMATTKNGFTPLHIAAKYGNMNVAKILLQKGVQLDYQGKNDTTPLHLACHYDHPKVANMILENGASPHLAFQNGHTPLHIAARKNQMDIASSLLDHGADPNAQSKAGFTPLQLSAQKGHYDMINLLIEHGADPNHKAKNGLTALHLCAQEDSIRVASVLVKNGANTEAETESGYRPIHIAAHFGNVSMIRFLLKHNAQIDVRTKQNYTPLHQAAQQGHAHVVTALLERNASHTARTKDDLTPLNIAQKLGYISVMEVLKGLAYDAKTPDNKTWEEKYKVIAPESLYETCFMSDSDDEGVSDGMTNEQPYRYLTADLMKSLRDDSLPIDVTRDDPIHRQLSKEEKQEFIQSNNYCPPENFDSTDSINLGFFVSFLVDARGGTMKGCRYSGIRIIVPPRRATMPIRVTCRLVKPSKVVNPPALMEGEALATRIIEMGPVGATFLGPVLIDIPHFASVHDKEREIIILRSETGEIWKEHDNSHENDDTLFNTPYDTQMSASHVGRITRIITTEFPQYFAVVTRIKQEVHVIGADGGILISSVANHVQAVFPPGALTKKIKVGLQAHVIQPELTAKLLGNCVAVSPVITIEPRRRKFHKPITLTIPVPQAASKGMINQYGGETPTLRLLCSIAGGTSEAQWEDVTGSTPLTFLNNRVSFTTTVSARFWLMDCRNISEVPKMATELYKESLFVPFITNFVIYTKRFDVLEATLRILCMTGGQKDGLHTLEKQEEFLEIVKSRDVETLDGKDIYLEFSGNLVPVTKSGQQLKFTFKAFRQNRLSFHVKVKDPLSDPVARMMFMRDPRVAKGEPAQQPICVLNIVLPEVTVQKSHSRSMLKELESGIIDKMDMYKTTYTRDYCEKRDLSKQLVKDLRKYIADTFENEQEDDDTIRDTYTANMTGSLGPDDTSNQNNEFDQKDISPNLENQTYSEKLRFWEDITKKRDSYQRSESEISRASQLTIGESDSECTQNITSQEIDTIMTESVEETIEDPNIPDISECSVAEKADYFEKQIQKEIITAVKPIKTTSQDSKKKQRKDSVEQGFISESESADMKSLTEDKISLESRKSEKVISDKVEKIDVPESKKDEKVEVESRQFDEKVDKIRAVEPKAAKKVEIECRKLDEKADKIDAVKPEEAEKVEVESRTFDEKVDKIDVIERREAKNVQIDKKPISTGLPTQIELEEKKEVCEVVTKKEVITKITQDIQHEANILDEKLNDKKTELDTKVPEAAEISKTLIEAESKIDSSEIVTKDNEVNAKEVMPAKKLGIEPQVSGKELPSKIPTKVGTNFTNAKVAEKEKSPKPEKPDQQAKVKADEFDILSKDMSSKVKKSGIPKRISDTTLKKSETEPIKKDITVTETRITETLSEHYEKQILTETKSQSQTVIKTIFDPSKGTEKLEEIKVINEPESTTITSTTDHQKSTKFEQKEVTSSEILDNDKKILKHEEKDQKLSERTSTSTVKTETDKEIKEDQLIQSEKLDENFAEKVSITLTGGKQMIDAAASKDMKLIKDERKLETVDDHETITAEETAASMLKERKVGAALNVEKSGLEFTDMSNLGISLEDELNAVKVSNESREEYSNYTNINVVPSRDVSEASEASDKSDMKPIPESEKLQNEDSHIKDQTEARNIAESLIQSIEDEIIRRSESSNAIKLGFEFGDDDVTEDELEPSSILEDKDEGKPTAILDRGAHYNEEWKDTGRNLKLRTSPSIKIMDKDLEEVEAEELLAAQKLQEMEMETVMPEDVSISEEYLESPPEEELPSSIDMAVSESSGARVIEILEPGYGVIRPDDLLDESEFDKEEYFDDEEEHSLDEKHTEVLDFGKIHASPAMENLDKICDLKSQTSGDWTSVSPTDREIKSDSNLEALSKVDISKALDLDVKDKSTSSKKLKELEISPVTWTIGNDKIEVKESLEPSEAFDKELDELQSTLRKDAESVDEEKPEDEKLPKVTIDGEPFEEPEPSSEIVVELADNEMESELIENKLDISCQELVATLQREFESKSPTHKEEITFPTMGFSDEAEEFKFVEDNKKIVAKDFEITERNEIGTKKKQISLKEEMEAIAGKAEDEDTVAKEEHKSMTEKERKEDITEREEKEDIAADNNIQKEHKGSAEEKDEVILQKEYKDVIEKVDKDNAKKEHKGVTEKEEKGDIYKEHEDDTEKEHKEVSEKEQKDDITKEKLLKFEKIKDKSEFTLRGYKEAMAHQFKSVDDTKRHSEKIGDMKEKLVHGMSIDSAPSKLKKDELPSVDLSSKYAITVLDQVVKREIAEVKESLEAAKQDLIEELSENDQTVFQIKDSPSEFQFKLQPETIPNDLPFLYKAPSVEQATEQEEQLSELSADTSKPDSESVLPEDAKSAASEIKVNVQDVEASQDTSLGPISMSSDVENKEDMSSSLSIPPQVVPRRRHKPARVSKKLYSESEGGSSSGESSNYQSCDYESGSRPSSSDVEALQSACGVLSGTASEYETALMSVEQGTTSKPTSQDYQSAASTLSSRESMKSLNSLSSGHLGSIDNTSELTETLVASEPEMDKEDIDENLELMLDDDKFAKRSMSKQDSTSSESEIQQEEAYTGDIDSDIPTKMKRSSEMIFQHISEDTDSSLAPIEGFEGSIDEDSKGQSTKATSSIMVSEEDDLKTSTLDVPSDHISAIAEGSLPSSASPEIKLQSIEAQSTGDDVDLSELKMTSMSAIDDQEALLLSKRSVLQQASMSTSSTSGMSVETVIERERPDRHSPDSDSFELVDKPDIMDDFVVIEEVGREAKEFDSEGKSISIKSIPQASVKKFDRDVENLIMEEKREDTASKPTRSNEVFDFEVEESPPQASNEESSQQSYSDDEMDAKKWIEMQFQADVRTYELECDRGPLEDIKEEEITDFEVGSSRFGSLGSHKGSIGSSGSMKGSYGEYDVLAGKKMFAKSTEHDNISMSSLQEFEHLESAVISGKAFASGSQDSVNNGSLPRRYVASRSGHGDDVSVSSLKDFEGLEKACREAHIIELRAKEEEDLLEHESPENRYRLEHLSKAKPPDTSAGSFNPSTSGSDDYEKRIMEIDEIIRIAQANVERLDRQDDTTEDISQIEITDVERVEPSGNILPMESENIQSVRDTNIMETSTDSLELENNAGKDSNLMNRSSDSLELKTTIDFPSLSYSDSLNNVRELREHASDPFNSARRISSDSLEASVLEHPEAVQSDVMSESSSINQQLNLAIDKNGKNTPPATTKA